MRLRSLADYGFQASFFHPDLRRLGQDRDRAPEGHRVGGLGMWIMNAMTPETADAARIPALAGVTRRFKTRSVAAESCHNDEVGSS
jgi:hypothetical protein